MTETQRAIFLSLHDTELYKIFDAMFSSVPNLTWSFRRSLLEYWSRDSLFKGNLIERSQLTSLELEPRWSSSKLYYESQAQHYAWNDQ